MKFSSRRMPLPACIISAINKRALGPMEQHLCSDSKRCTITLSAIFASKNGCGSSKMVLVRKYRHSASDNCSGPHWINAQSNGALCHVGVRRSTDKRDLISLGLRLPQQGEELRVPEQPLARVHICQKYTDRRPVNARHEVN